MKISSNNIIYNVNHLNLTNLIFYFRIFIILKLWKCKNSWKWKNIILQIFWVKRSFFQRFLSRKELKKVSNIPSSPVHNLKVILFPSYVTLLAWKYFPWNFPSIWSAFNSIWPFYHLHSCVTHIYLFWYYAQ
jgi:hypothetical protein